MLCYQNLSPYIQDSESDHTKGYLNVSPRHNVSLVSRNNLSTEKQSSSWGDIVPLYVDDKTSTEEKWFHTMRNSSMTAPYPAAVLVILSFPEWNYI